jgi:hypothetical protein
MSIADQIENLLERYERAGAKIPDRLPGNATDLVVLVEKLTTVQQAFSADLADGIGHRRGLADWEDTLWSTVLSDNLSQPQLQRALSLRGRILSRKGAAERLLGALVDASAEIVVTRYESAIPEHLPENAEALQQLANIVLAKFESITWQGIPGNAGALQQSSTNLEQVGRWHVAKRQAFLEELAGAIGYSREANVRWESRLWQVVRQKLSPAQARHARLLVEQLGDACAEIVFARYESVIPDRLPENVGALGQLSEWLITAKQTLPDELAVAIGHNRETSTWEIALWKSAIPKNLSHEATQRAHRLMDRIDAFERDAKAALSNARADRVLAEYEGTIFDRLSDSQAELDVLGQELTEAEQSFFADLADAIGHSRDLPGWERALWRSNVVNQLSEDRAQRAKVLRKQFTNARANIVLATYARIVSGTLLSTIV